MFFWLLDLHHSPNLIFFNKLFSLKPVYTFDTVWTVLKAGSIIGFRILPEFLDLKKKLLQNFLLFYDIFRKNLASWFCIAPLHIIIPPHITSTHFSSHRYIWNFFFFNLKKYFKPKRRFDEDRTLCEVRSKGIYLK